MLTYPVRPDTFHMTEDQQRNTLAIAVMVLIIIFIALKTVWDDWCDKWSIEDLTDDLFADRDQHAHDIRWAMRKARRDAERRAA